MVFKDPTFSSLLLRTIAETYYKGADIGECLSTAYRINEGDFESWYEEWLKTAKRVHSYADDCMAFGPTISAREAYLRASNYYRTAEFLLVEPTDPRSQTTIDLSKDCFRKAASTFPFVVVPIEIPYEGTFLPGYFYHATKEFVNIMKSNLEKTAIQIARKKSMEKKAIIKGPSLILLLIQR